MTRTGEHPPGEWISITSLTRLWEILRTTFWIVPAVSVVGSIGVAAGFVALDHHVGHIHSFLFYPGPPSGARSFLSSIVTSMITVTGTVFSVSVLVLQLTNTQFSSRAIRMYLRDLTVQATLGLFMATFVYAMVVQRSVAGGSAGGFVPRVSVSVAFLFVLASVALFIRYISHISDMVRVATIVKTLSQESRRLLERRYPADCSPRRRSPSLPHEMFVVGAPHPGVLVDLNERRLVQIAEESDCILAIHVRVGDFLPEGAPLCRVHRDISDGDRWDDDEVRSLEARLLRAIALDSERTMEQDLAFGFRQLVDIAEKALSPSLNDPTTATQCLDSIHDLLRRLAGRYLPDGLSHDGDGHLRLVIPQYSFSDYLEVALAEIWLYGRDGAQIRNRMSSMLADLEQVALPEHRSAVSRWRSRLAEAAPADVA
ncbi:MAG TPA: DUF2254 domain-containing protein [Acidimicrobiales bacterium]|nr:DUF2254 domain-containing protein [Acidimicrobiales bacterium]